MAIQEARAAIAMTLHLWHTEGAVWGSCRRAIGAPGFLELLTVLEDV